jgi:hypothetical protein
VRCTYFLAFYRKLQYKPKTFFKILGNFKFQRNNLVRVNNLTDEEPGGQWKKLKTKATSIACPEKLVQHVRSPSR